MNRRELLRRVGLCSILPHKEQFIFREGLEHAPVIRFVQRGVAKLRARIAIDYSRWRYAYLILPDNKYDLLQSATGHKGPYIVCVNMLNKANVYTADIILKPRSLSGKGHLLLSDKPTGEQWLFEVVQYGILS